MIQSHKKLAAKNFMWYNARRHKIHAETERRLFSESCKLKAKS